MNIPQRINCIKCKFYHVTWDANAPKGCQRFGFKSQKMPYLVVFESSGQNCMFFEEKF